MVDLIELTLRANSIDKTLKSFAYDLKFDDGKRMLEIAAQLFKKTHE